MGDKKKLRSLTIRWQPTEDKPFAEIVEWLNRMPIKERRKKVMEVCMMTILPYALQSGGKTEEEIERCYWEVHERLHQHLFVMRQTLQIKASIPLDSYSHISADLDPQKQRAGEDTDEMGQADLEEIDLIFGV